MIGPGEESRTRTAITNNRGTLRISAIEAMTTFRNRLTIRAVLLASCAGWGHANDVTSAELTKVRVVPAVGAARIGCSRTGFIAYSASLWRSILAMRSLIERAIATDSQSNARAQRLFSHNMGLSVVLA